ncbi:MAG: SO2930 family diheme c-type cytochrome [Chitinophagales bacterium]
MKNEIKFSLIAIAIAVTVIYSCKTETKKTEEITIEQKFPKDINFDEVPYKNLSDYGFFIGAQNELKPNEGVLLYEPSSMLFTDYAHKKRFVWMPKGTSASILDNEWQQIEYPDHSILIKNFYYPKDYKNPDGEANIVETRLLIKKDGKWDAYPYVWNEEQTEAEYKVIGGVIPTTFTTDNGVEHTIDYLVPNKHQCKSCHNQDEKFKPLGPKARNMNYDLDYGNGEVKNQLAKWAEMGYLNNFTAPENYQSVPNYDDKNVDLNHRAMAYLDANCGHCHNPTGPASTSGLFLTYEQTDTNKLGYYKTPVAAGLGAGSLTFDIHPGKADSSIIVYRMNSTKPGVMMAELGRVSIHEEGIELISEWINSLK